MRRHVGIGPVDLRIVEARFDHRGLGVVGDHKLRHSADRRKSVHMRGNPIGEALRPARLRIGEARCPHHRNEDLRIAQFAGEPVDNHRQSWVASDFNRGRIAGNIPENHRTG